MNELLCASLQKWKSDWPYLGVGVLKSWITKLSFFYWFHCLQSKHLRLVSPTRFKTRTTLRPALRNYHFGQCGHLRKCVQWECLELLSQGFNLKSLLVINWAQNLREFHVRTKPIYIKSKLQNFVPTNILSQVILQQLTLACGRSVHWGPLATRSTPSCLGSLQHISGITAVDQFSVHIPSSTIAHHSIARSWYLWALYCCMRKLCLCSCKQN